VQGSAISCKPLARPCGLNAFQVQHAPTESESSGRLAEPKTKGLHAEPRILYFLAWDVDGSGY
jgi:hypothetical protein